MPVGYSRVEAADEAMRDRLIEIWLDAFPGDTAADVTVFLDTVVRPDDCLVWLEEGRPVSMAFALPAGLACKGRELAVQYIYAAATLTPYRGRGLFGRLLTASHERAAARGLAASFLRPAGAGLFAYYARFGYRPYFYTQDVELSREEFGQYPRRAMPDTVIRWPSRVVAHAAALSAAAGGGLVTAGEARALCEPAGDGLLIREWMAPPGDPALTAAVAARFDFRRLRIRLPAGSPALARPFGVLCPLTREAERLFDRSAAGGPPYMGLALD